MVTKALRDDYKRMDATWPRPLPTPTFQELCVAYRRMRKKFRPNRPKMRMMFVETSGIRDNHTFQLSNRRVPTLKVILNPARGWDHFVHWLSHNFSGGHHDGHLQMEWAMIKHVRASGWLEGKLKRDPKPTASKRPLVEVRAERAQKMLTRAEEAYERAKARCTKWTRKVQYYQKKLAA